MYIISSLWKLISWYLRSQLGVALEVLSYLAKANIDNKQSAWNQKASLKHSYIDWKSMHCEGEILLTTWNGQKHEAFERKPFPFEHEHSRSQDWTTILENGTIIRW